MKAIQDIDKWIDNQNWCKCGNEGHAVLRASLSIVDGRCWTEFKHLETRFYCVDCKGLIKIEAS